MYRIEHIHHRAVTAAVCSLHIETSQPRVTAKNKREKFVDKAFKLVLSDTVKRRSERFILIISVVGYLLHLLLILLNTQGVIDIGPKFFSNPIAAVYTPFSFILIYEVYLLIFFLPKSMSSYIGKQYEIITLIVIRRIFKDIAQIELTSNWFQVEDDLRFTYDVVTSLVLFILIYLFYKHIRKADTDTATEADIPKNKVEKFVSLKRTLALLLVPLLVGLAVYTLADWLMAALSDYQSGILAFKKINNIFFDDFFTVLIIVDVLLLLATFFYSDKFHKIIRNSGFIISTVLIKMSFSVEGIVNNALIIGAVLFGFLILIIHNQFEKHPPNRDL